MWWTFVFLITCIRFSSCGVVVPPTEADWWEHSVIYEIFPLSFKDSDGDGFGDFKGIIQKLDYLVDIGVTAIWLTPFFESPLKSGGYDITNYCKVQEIFGTMDDFKVLINSAHKKKLKIIMDFVPNHTSDEHVWFQNSINKSSEFADYYIWKDAKNHEEVIKNSSITPIPPNNWRRCIGSYGDDSAWFWHNTRKQFYLSQFIGNLPDLNFHNEEIHKKMKTILSYWLELGVDGIRIDALRHVYENKEFLDEPIIDNTKPLSFDNLKHIYTIDQVEVYDLINEWHLLLDNFTQNSGSTRIIMTESYSEPDVLFKYYSSGAEIPTNFMLMFNFTHKYSAKEFDTAIQNWITRMPKRAVYNVVLQNHDQSRVPTKYGTEFTDCLNALSLFLPGVAIVYYGGEIGMEDIQDDINSSRSPMQWDNTTYAGFTNGNINKPWIEIHPSYVKKNVQNEINDPKSHLNFFKNVTRLRKTATLKNGGLATYIFNENVFALNRFLPGNENYTLVINMDSKPQHVRLSDQMTDLYGHRLTVVSSSRNSYYNSGDSISTESIILSPGETVIFSDYYSSTGSTPSSSTQLYKSFYVLLLSLFIIKICCQ